MMHVTVMVLSYAALIIGSLLSIGFLVISGFKNQPDSSVLKIKKEVLGSPSFTGIGDEQNSFLVKEIFVANTKEQSLRDGINDQKEGGEMSTRRDLAKILDNLSYRILGFGFPLLTIGILSGAVWANEAWGSYWSWDPKETWALLTWLIFAIYLHTRLNKGWEGKKPALIASFGFIIVWICFLGVNLLGEGLHSYGWLNKN
jgi:cytochrome c-type biogenesis protein CcsB